MHNTAIPNWDKKTALYTPEALLIDNYQVMMNWETPIMQKMAEMLHQHTQGEILEAGFGMGISSTHLQKLGVAKHTILEAHPKVYEHAQAWAQNFPQSQITLIQDYWENAQQNLPQYDGIFFDTFSSSVEEMDLKRFDLFQVASERLLRPNGALTFFFLRPALNEVYQQHLYRYFSKVYTERLKIEAPADCHYAQFIREVGYTLCVLAIK